MAKRSRVRRTRKNIAAVIRTDEGQELQIPGGNELQEMAVRWAYLIRNRNHWNKREQTTMRSALQQQIRGFGFSRTDFHKLAECRLIEVDIPFTSESAGWEARVMPWEFILTNITDRQPGGNSPIVIRRLKLGRRKQKKRKAQFGRFAFVQSAPGPLAEFYDFAKEQSLLFNSLRSTNWLKFSSELNDPSLAELRSELRKTKPELVHVTGIDVHQGAELLRVKDTRFDDGLYLRDPAERRSTIPIAAAQIADALAGDEHRPDLIGLNFFHSAPRIAPLTVAAGASAVIAFQDVMDDTLSEMLFADLYRAWSQSPGDLLLAFEETMRNLMRSSGLTLAGTGIVLWSADSLLDLPKELEKSAENYSEKATLDSLASNLSLDQLIEIDVQHRDNINYSLLHNGRRLFQKLYLVNRTGKRLENVQVKVRLFVGQDSDEQTIRLSLAGPAIDLRSYISLPLLSRQLRCFRESVMTCLKLTVEWEGQLITDRNLSVRILPINEWCDSDEERQWLPSFVQPLDPAVSRILAAAERHLRTISSNPYAGFDGYQQVEGVDEPDLDLVDQQVEAIWDALLHDFTLAYVNPPPTYTLESQRIREPNEVLASGRGTCLDLTVLLASCLEHVDIYPAIILLQGHAFPAYWRSPEHYDEFWGSGQLAMQEVIDYDASHGRGKLDDQHHRYLWMTRGTGYSRLTKAVASGHLAPLESVWLTMREPFNSARDAGGENLIDRNEFECLIDIRRARELNVLPLPEKD